MVEWLRHVEAGLVGHHARYALLGYAVCLWSYPRRSGDRHLTAHI